MIARDSLMQSVLAAGLLLACLALPAAAQDTPSGADAEPGAGAEKAENPVTLDGLLEAVQAGRVGDTRDNAQRLREFKSERANRQQMLNDIIAEEKRQEALTAYLDGALTPAERKRFERLLASDRALRASLEEQRLIKASLRRLPRMRAPRNFTLDPARYGRPYRWAASNMASTFSAGTFC